MTARARRREQGRLIGWIGWAGLDAMGRLALLTGSTIVFSRLLAPRDFGVTALVLTLVAVAAVFVGSPFEEALAQRRGVRMAHLRAALGASWAIGAVILAASIPAGHALAEQYGEPEFRSLLPVAMASSAQKVRRLRSLSRMSSWFTGEVAGTMLATCRAEERELEVSLILPLPEGFSSIAFFI